MANQKSKTTAKGRPHRAWLVAFRCSTATTGLARLELLFFLVAVKGRFKSRRAFLSLSLFVEPLYNSKPFLCVKCKYFRHFGWWWRVRIRLCRAMWQKLECSPLLLRLPTAAATTTLDDLKWVFLLTFLFFARRSTDFVTLTFHWHNAVDELSAYSTFRLATDQSWSRNDDDDAFWRSRMASHFQL